MPQSIYNNPNHKVLSYNDDLKTTAIPPLYIKLDEKQEATPFLTNAYYNIKPDYPGDKKKPEDRKIKIQDLRKTSMLDEAQDAKAASSGVYMRVNEQRSRFSNAAIRQQTEFCVSPENITTLSYPYTLQNFLWLDLLDQHGN